MEFFFLIMKNLNNYVNKNYQTLVCSSSFLLFFSLNILPKRYSFGKVLRIYKKMIKKQGIWKVMENNTIGEVK